jgi:hypothetical protein
MNWRRGFLRLWIVASLGWIGGTTLATYQNVIGPRDRAAAAQVCADARKANPTLANRIDCIDADHLLDDLVPIQAVARDYALLAFGPVLSVLIIGLVGGWIITGFRRPTG